METEDFRAIFLKLSTDLPKVFPNFRIMFRTFAMIAEDSQLGFGRWFDVCWNVSDNFLVGKDVRSFPRKSKGVRVSSN